MVTFGVWKTSVNQSAFLYITYLQDSIMNIKVLGIIVMMTLGTTIVGATPILIQQVAGKAISEGDLGALTRAPTIISGDNVYIAWWTNKTGNDEVLFRASTDGGATFGDKINLSNTTAAESQDAEIAGEGGNVVVTWWERNQTADEPVARISTDAGQTFGPMLMLATNGTIGEVEEEPAEGE